MAFIPLYDDNPHRFIGRGGQGVTWVMIGLNTAIFIFFQSGWLFETDDAAVLSFALIPAVYNGLMDRPEELLAIPPQVTLLTYAFLHGDFFHLIGNMLFLWVFGDNVEDAVGHWRFLLFYLLAAVGGGLAQVLLLPDSEAALVGASGAVAGIVSAYLILYPRAKIWVLVLGRIPLRFAAMWVLGAWILIQFWSVMAASDGEVAWWAHIGGLAVGAVLIVVLRRPGLPLFAQETVGSREPPGG